MTSSARKIYRRSPGEIIALLRQKISDGDSTAAFCLKHDISEQTFYNWQKKYGQNAEVKSDFIPIKVDHSMGTDIFCELTLPSKASIRFFHPVDATFLKTLISRW